ncbi:FAD-dependent monooxygenase [Mycolicibacterium sp. XJ2546]
MTEHRIAVIGAGPVGLSAAAWLACHGIPVTVFEDDAMTSSAPKAGTVVPRALEFFDRLGVIDKVLESGIRIESVDFIKRTTEAPLMRVDMTELQQDTAFPFFLNLPQHEFEPILLQRAVQLGAEIRFGHRLVGLSQRDDGCVLSLETDDGTVEYEADYVLGCDGGKSTVRRQLGLRYREITPPEQFIVVNAETDVRGNDGHPPDSLSYLCDANGFFTRIRLPKFWRLGWAAPADAPELTDADIEERLRKELGPDQPFRVLDWAQYSSQGRVLDQFRVGRVFLLGDAAHLVTPIGGLGLNTGFEDAFNFGWKLAWVLRGWASPALLDTYSDERQPIIAGTAMAMQHRKRSFMEVSRSRLANAVSAVRRQVNLRDPRRRWAAAYSGSLLGLNYLQAPDTKPVLRPPISLGDRVPDGSIFGPDGRIRRLHNLLGRDFVALTFVDWPAEAPLLTNSPPGLVQVLISCRDAPLDSEARSRTYFDVRGTLTKRFGAKSGTTYLVRPDDFTADITSAEPAAIVTAYAKAVGTALTAATREPA